MDAITIQVFWVALGTCLATGLGAVPFVFAPNLTERWHGLAAAVAGGMMISASVFALTYKALARGDGWAVLVGLLTGALFFDWTAKRLEHKHWHIGDLSEADSRPGVLMIATMFVHSIPEGVAVGVGYATGELRFGLLLALAIAIHNIPEGIAVTLPLRAKGVPLRTCAAFAILTSVPQPLLAVPAYLLVAVFQRLLSFGLGFAGGAMIFLVVAELLPESFAHCSVRETAWGVMVGLVIMLGLTIGLAI